MVTIRALPNCPIRSRSWSSVTIQSDFAAAARSSMRSSSGSSLRALTAAAGDTVTWETAASHAHLGSYSRSIGTCPAKRACSGRVWDRRGQSDCCPLGPVRSAMQPGRPSATPANTHCYRRLPPINACAVQSVTPQGGERHRVLPSEEPLPSPHHSRAASSKSGRPNSALRRPPARHQRCGAQPLRRPFSWPEVHRQAEGCWHSPYISIMPRFCTFLDPLQARLSALRQACREPSVAAVVS